MTFLDDLAKPFKQFGKDFKHTTSDVGKWFKGAGDTVTHAVGSVGDRLLSSIDNVSQGVKGLTSPTFLIIAGIAVVGIVIIMAKR